MIKNLIQKYFCFSGVHKLRQADLEKYKKVKLWDVSTCESCQKKFWPALGYR